MSKAISVSGLVKSFGDTRALDGIDLEVETGGVHALLGTNGAGKTTTVGILRGLVRADGGRAQVLGSDPWSGALGLESRLAFVPDDVDLGPSLTGGDVIDRFTRLRGHPDRRRRDALCERFDLDPTRPGSSYSKGNRQKVALISALASDVGLLLLDEPTSGLDPAMEAVFVEVVREARDAGTTVLLSSRTVAQVEPLADHLSILRDGRVVESGDLAELHRLERTAMTAETTEPAHALARLPGVHNLHARDGHVSFEVDSDRTGAVVRHLALLGVTSLTAHPPTLEQLLARHEEFAPDLGQPSVT